MSHNVGGERKNHESAARSAANLPKSLTREERWWRSILRDISYGLRNQPELSREEIADVIDNALKDGVPGA